MSYGNEREKHIPQSDVCLLNTEQSCEVETREVCFSRSLHSEKIPENIEYQPNSVRNREVSEFTRYNRLKDAARA